MTLQQSINTYGPARLVIDGLIGPITLEAAQAAWQKGFDQGIMGWPAKRPQSAMDLADRAEIFTNAFVEAASLEGTPHECTPPATPPPQPAAASAAAEHEKKIAVVEAFAEAELQVPHIVSTCTCMHARMNIHVNACMRATHIESEAGL